MASVADRETLQIIESSIQKQALKTTRERKTES